MTNYKDLPVFKTMDITEKADLSMFRKFELGIFKMNKALLYAILAGGGFLFYKYVLDGLFIALGKILATGLIGMGIVALYFLFPVFIKGMRVFARFLHKHIIRLAPFEEMHDAIAKFYNDLKSVDNSIGIIKKLENDTMNSAKHYEEQAVTLKERIISNKKKIDAYRAEKQKIINAKGQEASFDDEYVRLDIAENELSAETLNLSRQQKQAEDLVVKYGARHKVMKGSKIKMQKVRSFMRIKISETETTVKLLEIDYKFAKEGSDAMTKAQKAAKGLEGSWNLDYALEVVNNTIQADLHKMSMSIKEIESIAGDFNLDNDAMYDKLSATVESLQTKEIISSDKFSNPNTPLTEKEKVSSGLSGLFS